MHTQRRIHTPRPSGLDLQVESVSVLVLSFPASRVAGEMETSIHTVQRAPLQISECPKTLGKTARIIPCVQNVFTERRHTLQLKGRCIVAWCAGAKQVFQVERGTVKGRGCRRAAAAPQGGWM